MAALWLLRYIGAEGVDPKLQEALQSDKPIQIEQGNADSPMPGTRICSFPKEGAGLYMRAS